MYRAILFDLDDTLYDFRVYWRRRLHRALASVLERHPHLDREELTRSALAERVYMEQFPDFLHRCGVADQQLIARATEIFRRGWFEEIALADDAAPTLQTLRARYRLGLVTNGPSHTQRPKIERFGLEQLMDTLIVSGEVGVAKPDPAIFALALARLGASPAEALFVGDSPEYDLRGAAAAGIPFVWMNRLAEPAPPDVPPPLATITRLSELPPLLKEIDR